MQSNSDYLELFDSMPNLLRLAMGQSPKDPYALQNELREQYREANLVLKWSMPLRCFGHCRKCSQQFTQVIYELEDPKQKISASTNSSHIHAVKEHSASMDGKLKEFLEQVTTGDYSGSEWSCP